MNDHADSCKGKDEVSSNEIVQKARAIPNLRHDYSGFKSEHPPRYEMFALASAIHMESVLNHKTTDLSVVSKLSTQEQAQYADPITIGNVDSKWLGGQIEMANQIEPSISQINATGLGNAAYIALYAKSKKTKQNGKRMLKRQLRVYRDASKSLLTKLLEWISP